MKIVDKNDTLQSFQRLVYEMNDVAAEPEQVCHLLGIVPICNCNLDIRSWNCRHSEPILAGAD
ncbi:MAG TPA: hypothetical protein VF146_00140 [Bryobacteraceae bacterium]